MVLLLLLGACGGGVKAAPETTTLPQLAGFGPGCALHTSSAGYPNRYLGKPFPYQKHPPLPAVGWHDDRNPVTFKEMFHAVFHGYTVVEYRQSLTGATTTALRSWVTLHARSKVVSTPAAPEADGALVITVWGYELDCDATAQVDMPALDQLLTLRSQ